MVSTNAFNVSLKNCRLKILEMYYKAHAGHIGCSLSCIDLMASVFFKFKKDDDKFILSKGHAAVSLYVCLHEVGEIKEDDLLTFYKDGTTLPAHPAPGSFNGISFANGSLGHGFPVAAGIAKAKKLKGDHSKVYVLMSDGETNAGTTWEAAHFAVSHQLNNLIVIIDKNGLQGFGKLEEVLGDTASFQKWIDLGFEVCEIDGHDLDQIENCIRKLQSSETSSPKLVIANTVKGKGVSYMEDKLEWHYLPMTEELYEKAVEEIKIKYSA
jgi:transketolase